MALLTKKDIKDVSDLVTKKLELYANREKRENGFDPDGSVRTTHKMYRYDFMYRVLDYDVWDRDSPRYPKKKKNKSKGNSVEEENNEKGEHGEGSQNEDKSKCINPKILHTSRRMVLYKEVDRLATNATKVFETLPIDKLQVIHRYRPSYHGKIDDIPETGKVQNYTRHVGAVLKSQDYVNYYIKEGLQTGDASKSKRLQEIPKEKKDADNEDKKDSSDNVDEDKKTNKDKKRDRPKKELEPIIKVKVTEKKKD
ncbi:uncharacterized protein LOC134712314 isoform X2 [Mytilus trossulus]|uniref:uncharacterized protein LOC134712314 isoform X2 n=1 Tax=Mytilus trossulus TaxID=6551 RepID=UPI00300640CE